MCIFPITQTSNMYLSFHMYEAGEIQSQWRWYFGKNMEHTWNSFEFSQLYHLLVVWPWRNYIISLKLILTCSMWILLLCSEVLRIRWGKDNASSTMNDLFHWLDLSHLRELIAVSDIKGKSWKERTFTEDEKEEIYLRNIHKT